MGEREEAGGEPPAPPEKAATRGTRGTPIPTAEQPSQEACQKPKQAGKPSQQAPQPPNVVPLTAPPTVPDLPASLASFADWFRNNGEAQHRAAKIDAA